MAPKFSASRFWEQARDTAGHLVLGRADHRLVTICSTAEADSGSGETNERGCGLGGRPLPRWRQMSNQRGFEAPLWRTDRRDDGPDGNGGADILSNPLPPGCPQDRLARAWPMATKCRILDEQTRPPAPQVTKRARSSVRGPECHVGVPQERRKRLRATFAGRLVAHW